MAYVVLLAAIACEVVATSFLTATDGFTRVVPTAGVLAGYVASFVLLAIAVRDIPVGVAYATWAGLGTVAIAAIAVTVGGESVTLVKVVGLALVVVGTVALNLGGAH